MTGPSGAALDARGVTIDYVRRRARTRAVDDVTLTVGHGETVGLVGESGSGKTSLATAALGLTALTAGSITVNGHPVRPGDRRGAVRAGVQAVFQSPYSSLDPAMPVAAILAEPLGARARRGEAAADRVREALAAVGLDESVAHRYPREFSGGQRQRISIARAMVAGPRLLICDEPTSALDLSVQARVVNLLMDLQRDRGISYLVIGHDLALMNHLAHRLYVMYRGRIVESGPAAAVYATPTHPYTRALVAAAPLPDPARQRQRRALAVRPAAAAPPGPAPGHGCAFLPRCPFALDRCATEVPALRRIGTVEVACHNDTALAVRP